jgi:hypothetical protein
MPSAANLAIYQGDDYAAVVTVSGGSTQPDISQYTAQAQIRLGPADSNAQVVVEIATQISSPQITLSIPRDITAQLSGKYAWDLQLIAPDGTVQTILAGNVWVTPEITRELSSATIHRHT